MKKLVLFSGLWSLVSGLCFAADEYNFQQTVYVDTPVQSYRAYPEDINFIPENNFMQRADDINYDENMMAARDVEYMMHPGVSFVERPSVICRDFNCTRLNDRITRTFLFNSISNTFMVNSNTRLHICEADPFSRNCLQSGIAFPARIGIANAMVKIPDATISDVNITAGLSRASVSMTYDFLVNGIEKQCEPTVMDIVIPSNSSATLLNREFSCDITSDGATNINLMVSIDYIDLDYGILGGYYSLGLQGPTSGGGTGYALFKTEYSSRGMQYKSATDSPSESAPGEYEI